MVHTQYSHKNEATVSDAALVKLVLAGNREVFADLVKRYEKPLFHFIYHFLNDYEQAGDTLQDVFLRFYIALPQLDASKPLKPWLYHVAHNCCVDEVRHGHNKLCMHFSQLISENDRGEEVAFDMPDAATPIDELCEQHVLQEKLERAISTLSVKMKTVVLLRYTSNLRFGDIGRIMGIPEATAKTYFNRAKRYLREELKKDAIFGSKLQ
ncbi:RNA polymerase sigma factor [Dictyobacter aurantiacus]|uniref:RNA polymerase sigma factor n=1 Tax=Dictyobacter aurantiacus TaxID=1936993 RepID=A0A401Z970_9CHLR|nr:sigma-70 family RNA polymerase sigma factor [Dictyobacter aurantiacus]GCE03379.1 RNA polymerase sigma factor [Dictyobacter aurantiacus]